MSPRGGSCQDERWRVAGVGWGLRAGGLWKCPHPVDVPSAEDCLGGSETPRRIVARRVGLCPRGLVAQWGWCVVLRGFLVLVG
jgi:hypothetical protein